MNTENLLPSWANEQKTCSICFDDFQSKEWVRQMNCFHLFHSRCIGEWINRTNSCPTCRKEVEVTELKPSFRYASEAEKNAKHKRQCQICRSFYLKGEALIQLKCQHIFHKKCVKQHNLAECSICKKKLILLRPRSFAKLATVGTLFFLTCMLMVWAVYQEKNTLVNPGDSSYKITALIRLPAGNLSLWAPLYTILTLALTIHFSIPSLRLYQQNRLKNFHFSKVSS